MNAGIYRNEYGELITMQQTAELSNLGMSTVRKIAQEADAVVRIGKSVRIKRRKFFDYIDATYTE